MNTETPPNPAAAPWSAPSVVAATCLWLGRIPFAPGTWGAAAGAGLSLLTGAAAQALDRSCGFPSLAVEATLLVVVNLVGIPICTAAARRLGRGSDPGAIVLDEATSVPLGLLVVPWGERTWPVLVAGWFIHRVFDVTKPFPCRQLEHLPAGLGVMADDWGAAMWMAVVLAAVRWLGWV